MVQSEGTACYHRDTHFVHGGHGQSVCVCGGGHHFPPCWHRRGQPVHVFWLIHSFTYNHRHPYHPSHTHTHTLTHALRLQEFRAGYTRTPLNSTCWLHSNEYLTSVAKLITEQSLRALLTLYTHPPTHTCAHISKKQGLIYRSALQNNQSSPAQVY